MEDSRWFLANCEDSRRVAALLRLEGELVAKDSDSSPKSRKPQLALDHAHDEASELGHLK